MREPAKEDSSEELVPVRHFETGSEDSSADVEQILEDEHRRMGVRPFSAEVEEYERLDSDRRAEILHRIDELTGLDADEWTEADRDAAGIEIDWKKLREGEPDYGKVFDDLEQKYNAPPGLFRLSVRPEEDVNWQPGDFFSVKLPETPGLDPTGYRIPEHIEDAAEDETPFKAYSAASSPNSEAVDFYIKRIPDEAASESSLTPVLEAKLQETDEVTLRGPYNDELSINEASDRDVVYVATGTGMAPMKGMLDFTLEEGLDSYKGEDRDIWIFLGASYRDELPGHGEFEEMAEGNDNVHYVPTVSREESLSDWEGETEYVQDVLEKYSDEIGLENAEIYVCGLSKMAEEVRSTLDGLDWDTDGRFYQEEVFD